MVMKTTKFLFALLTGAMMMTSCDNSPNIVIEYPDDYVPEDTSEVVPPQPEIKKLPIAENIIGEWVADYAIDDPQGYRWEVLKFMEQNVLYFSNYSETRGVGHSYENGTYTIGDTIITTSCQLGWTGGSVQYNTEMRLSYIDAYKMKADIWYGGEVIASNTYQKVVGSVDIEKGDMLPDYAQMLGGQTPRSFSSHNPYVATVDEQGKIASQWSGSTYIDITTDQGTAALQVNVNSIFYFDYEDYIGASLKDIVKVFEERTSTEQNVMVYNYNDSYYPSLQRKSGNWNQMRIRLSSGLVDVVTLYAREDIRFTEYQIEDFLKARYNVYMSGTDQENSTLNDTEQQGSMTFFLGKTLEEATLGVSWNQNTRALRIFSLNRNKDNLLDYGHFMGMKKSDVEAIMGKPTMESSNPGEWIMYSLSNKNVNSVQFRFTNRDTKELKTTVQEINVRLQDRFAVEEAQTVLDAKYTLDDEGSDCRIYSISEPKMYIYLYGAPTNQIAYINKDPNV